MKLSGSVKFAEIGQHEELGRVLQGLGQGGECDVGGHLDLGTDAALLVGTEFTRITNLKSVRSKNLQKARLNIRIYTINCNL